MVYRLFVLSCVRPIPFSKVRKNADGSDHNVLKVAIRTH